ncbi:hypothetical protein [Lewinella sp. W8]|uniref:hypothetical protein n=1 Tax=Lewinella sp. W8 TaxID=2528208 RepID=UPI0010682663|nr:hypothetical protein [Lewinella sp. W8]MTB49607.1 hypothetical protein [Lewinella sp. W8]
MILAGVDILVKLDKEEPYRIGERVSGRVIIVSNREFGFYGLQAHLHWRVKSGAFTHREEIWTIQLAKRTTVEAYGQQEFKFSFPEPVDRSTFVAQQLDARFMVVARITPIRSSITKVSGDKIHLFSRSYVEGTAAINVLPTRFTYRVAPQNLYTSGVDLWWLGSAGGWLATTLLGATVPIVAALGALTITTMIYTNRLHYLQETPMRVLEGGDNGMRILLFTSSDARVLDGRLHYQIRDVRLDREEQKQVGLAPLIQVGGRIRDFGRMTSEGFEVVLPWITRPLPPANRIGASHYRWELVLRPPDNIHMLSKTWGLSVRQL